jgi:hypothetical protein
VQQRERDAAGEEGLARQVQQHRGILADRVHQDGLGELGGHFAEDVDALGFEAGQVREPAHAGVAARVGTRFQGRHRRNLGLYLGVHRVLPSKNTGQGPASRIAGDCTDANPRPGKHFWLCRNNTGVTAQEMGTFLVS